MCVKHIVLPIFIWSFLLYCVKNTVAEDFSSLSGMIGNNDAVLVADKKGKTLFSINSQKELIPASTLKLLTSLTALHYLGEDYRFITEFYIDDTSNLMIKGYGDPLLISEVIEKIAADLSSKMGQPGSFPSSLNNIVVDDSYFDPIVIPGSSASFEPYDASNSALCVNFNTVNFSRGKDGRYISAEPQTPLLPFVLDKVNRSGLDRGRILLSREQGEIALYAGHLFHYFLSRKGMVFRGDVRLNSGQSKEIKLVYRFTSPYPLKELIANLLNYSNNFMTNQLLIVSGAKAFGPPGTLEKGIRAERWYSQNVLKIEDIKIAEGAGISRENRVTATMMMRILEAFEPYRELLRHREKEYYKTGTLDGISTRAGYIETHGERYRFVILANTPGKSAEKIADKLITALEKE